MTYNPRIINLDNNVIQLSASVVTSSTSQFNSITGSSISASIGKFTVITASNVNASSLVGPVLQQITSSAASSSLYISNQVVASSNYTIQSGDDYIKFIVSNLTATLPDRKSTRLNSSHVSESRMPSSA